MKSIKTLGIMSGTSLDGVDFVLSHWNENFDGKYIGHASVSFPKKLKKQLMECAEGKMNVRDATRLHHDLGRFYAKSAQSVIGKRKWKVDLIGLHGQTVFHEAPGATSQIGEPSYLASETKKPIVADFRVADLSAGGQGAPLATFFHALLLKEHLKHGPCAFHNLGGISNVSYFPKGDIKVKDLNRAPISSRAMSFDTGPANMLMDAFMRKNSQSFDKDGHFAATGFVNFKLINKWINADKFMKKKPPKSCGREEYGEKYLQKILKDMKGMSRADQAATLTEFSAMSIAHAYRTFLPTLPEFAIFAGGGTKNSHLMFRIRYHLPEIEIVLSDEFGWPTQSIEGGAFAALAVARFSGKFGHLPQTTGAKRGVLLGKIVQTIK
jgi:anhydro-N-acetylmuramic acid kinase